MTDLLNKLTQLSRNLSRKKPAGSSLDETAVRRLMHLLDDTQEEMYCCEETFDLLDEYVERATSSEDVALLMPYVKHHLDRCPHCHEAYQALSHILEADAPSGV